MNKRLKQVQGAKDKLAAQMDNLSISDRHYDKKYDDYLERLDKFYDEIEELEEQIATTEGRVFNLRKQRVSADSVYQFLILFDKMYSRYTDKEKKEFMNSFIEKIEIHEKEQENGQILKSIKLRFPVYYNDIETDVIRWDNLSIDETVCLLSRKALV